MNAMPCTPAGSIPQACAQSCGFATPGVESGYGSPPPDFETLARDILNSI
jgi:hypothetical protein